MFAVVAMVVVAQPAPDGGIVAEDITRAWADQPVRAFVSGHLAAGFFNRVMVAAGYGRPHWLWGGVEVQAMTTTEFGAVYGGVRFEGLVVNAMAGVRHTWAYQRRLPQLAATYDDAGLFRAEDPRSFVLSVDASLWGFIPAGPTLGYWELSGVFAPLVKGGRAVFDEFLRLTLHGGVGAVGRLSWSLTVWRGRILVGPVGEVAVTPGRSVLVRVGGGASWQITRHLVLQLSLTVPVASPDFPGLGWFTQSWGIARITWSWATGDPRPGL